MLGDIISPIYIFAVFAIYTLIIFVITDFLTYLRVFILYMVVGYGVFSIWSIYFLLDKAYASHSVWYKYTLYLYTLTMVASFTYDIYGFLKNSSSYAKKFKIHLYEIRLTENKIDTASFFEKMKNKGDSLSGNGIFLKIFMYISLPIAIFGKTGAYFLGTFLAKEFGVLEYVIAITGLAFSLFILYALVPICITLFKKLKYPTQEEIEAYKSKGKV